MRFQLATLVASALLVPVQAQPSREQVDKVLAEVSRITGLAVKRTVPVESLTREEWKRWVDEEVRRTVKPAEIRADEMLLKKFGLLPADFDLRQATVDLLGEQAAAIYDHRRHRMLLVEGSGGPLEEALLVHELTHALGDQHFKMSRFLEKGAQTDEGQTARMAVVEGQAMWVMVESQVNKLGQSLKTNRAPLEMMLPLMGKVAADAYPVFSKAPLYLRETLVFPYSAGLLFQQAAVEKFGQQGVAEVLRRPPETTQQVLHPELWLAPPPVARPALPPLPPGPKLKRVIDGTIGELDFRILFTQYGSEKEGAEAAAGWRGGAFELLEKGQSGRTTLRWSAAWASPEAAARAFGLYRRVLQGKWKKFEVKEDGPSVLAGEGDDGPFRITLTGDTMAAVEGVLR